MMQVARCDRVRDQLPALYDGELTLDEQVVVQGHLQECVACRLEVDSLDELGRTLRNVSVVMGAHVPIETGRIASPVLERVRVERQLSVVTQLRTLFEDMHLVWAGLGATVATIICVFASAGVLQAANRERPDSLRGIITYLANPGSNANPVMLDGYMLAPRAQVNMTLPAPIGGDSDVMVAAVVSREGVVQNIAVLDGVHDGEVAASRAELLAMVNAASRARFQPALAGGEPVAVSTFWLLSSTTVKGQPDYDLYLLSPPRLMPTHGPALPRKTRVEETPQKLPSTMPSTEDAQSAIAG